MIAASPVASSSLDELPTPALLVDLDRVDANLEHLVASTAPRGIVLSPHAKTHRIPLLGLHQLERGAERLTVATLVEAEGFADAGVGALFVAYPIVGVGVAARALALHRRVDLRLGVDSLAGAMAIAESFAAVGERAGVLIAVDTGLGREGVDIEDAPALAAGIAALDGVELVGVFTHEGHAYGAVDAADLVTRSQDAARAMVEVARTITAAGIPCPVVSLGCSASVAAVVEVPGVTEIRPGIAGFGDVGLLALGVHAHDRLAVRVLATVVSSPSPGRACIDAGSKSLGSDAVLASAHRDEFGGFGLLEFVGVDAGERSIGWGLHRLSEEHGWLQWDPALGPAPELPVGTRVAVVPNHVCMAFAALGSAVVTRGDTIVDRWIGLGPRA
jgi:D-serine deaminase-like pyridoxal phosphate-dependent protein